MKQKMQDPAATACKDRNNGRTALNMLTLIAIGIMLVFSSCKREVIKPAAVNGPVKTTMSVEEGKKLKGRIQSFYAQMKALKGTHVYAKGAEETMPIDSVEFLTEATYNYYTARNADEHILDVNFTISEPSSNGDLDLGDVSDAFWRIKDSLVEKYNLVSYTDKELATLDLDIVNNGSSADFKIKASITDGPAPDGNYIGALNGKKYLTTASTHAYSVWPQGTTYFVYVPGPFGGNFIYGYGQADLDVANKSLVPGTIDLTVPDAMSMIRSLGKYNTFAPGFGTAYTNLVTGVHSIDITTANGTTLPSPYLITPGFAQSDIYNTVKFYTGSGSSATLNDPDVVFKDWLSTPLMNTYIAAVPMKLAAALPAGKSYYDFNVVLKFCTCFPQPVQGQYNDQAFLSYNYYYKLSYGDLSSVTLPSRTQLPQF